MDVHVVTAAQAIEQGTTITSMKSIISWCHEEIRKEIATDRHFAKKKNRPPNKNIPRVTRLYEQIDKLKVVIEEMEAIQKKGPC